MAKAKTAVTKRPSPKRSTKKVIAKSVTKKKASTDGKEIGPKCHPNKRLASNPLLEFRSQSIDVGFCNSAGARGKGLMGRPWAFQIAVNGNKNDPPSLRTMSFQRVNEEGIDFYNPKHALKLAGRAASICTMTGDYPSPHGPQCIQWRAEGKVKSIKVAPILKTAPNGSFA